MFVVVCVESDSCLGDWAPLPMLTLITEMQLPQSPHEVAASAPEHKHGPHSSHPPRGLTAVFSHHSLQHSLITLCSIVSSLSAALSHHSLQYSLITLCSILSKLTAVFSGGLQYYHCVSISVHYVSMSRQSIGHLRSSCRCPGHCEGGEYYH